MIAIRSSVFYTPLTPGMKEKDVEQVADFIAEALTEHTNEEKLHAIRDKVFAFNRAFPLPW